MSYTLRTRTRSILPESTRTRFSPALHVEVVVREHPVLLFVEQLHTGGIGGGRHHEFVPFHADGKRRILVFVDLRRAEEGAALREDLAVFQKLKPHVGGGAESACGRSCFSSHTAERGAAVTSSLCVSSTRERLSRRLQRTVRCFSLRVSLETFSRMLFFGAGPRALDVPALRGACPPRSRRAAPVRRNVFSK